MKDLIAIALTALLTACGSDRQDAAVGSDTSACQKNNAQISMGDGGLRRICGCDEEAGTFFSQSEKLRCTFKGGTVVTFLFTGNVLSHQVVSFGGHSFASSAISDPKSAASTVSTHSVELHEVGSYPFMDGMNPTYQGTLIVR